MKIGRIAAIVTGIGVIGFVAFRFVTSKKEVGLTDTRPSVMAIHPEKRDIEIYTEQIGTVAPISSVSVFPKMVGEVLSVNFNQGDNVNAGDELATINSDALTSLKIQMDAAKVGMEDAAAALARTKALADTGAVSAQALEQANSAAASTGLNYEAAKSQYDLQSSYTSIKAPISGVVETKNIEVHDMLSGTAPIAVISGNEGMEVKFGVTGEVQSRLNQGDQIKVLSNGTEYTGNITEVAGVVGSTGLYDAKASLEGAKGLQTGTKVKLTLLKNRVSDVLTVPLSSVLYSGNAAYVYVYEGEKAMKKDVTVGLYDGEYIEVKEGLTSGDNVITTWSNELYDTAEVILSDGNTFTPEQSGAAEETGGK